MWTCAKCGAEIEAENAACAKCAASTSQPGSGRPLLFATLFSLLFAVADGVLVNAIISHNPSRGDIVRLLMKANGVFLLSSAAAIAFGVTAIRRIGTFRPITLLPIFYFILIATYWVLIFRLIRTTQPGR